MSTGKKHSKPSVILVGPAEEMYNLWLDLKRHYDVQGIFSNDTELPPNMEKMGNEEEALPFIKENAQICAVYCHLNSANVRELYLYSQTSYVEFYGVPSIMPFHNGKIRLSQKGKTMLLSTERGPIERILRHAFRVLLCIVLFLTVVPLICVPMAIAVKRKSPGPILSFRKKIGRLAKEHTLVCFRGYEEYCFDTYDAKFILTK